MSYTNIVVRALQLSSLIQDPNRGVVKIDKRED